MAHSKNCQCCGGTGKEKDNARLGLVLSGLRLRANIGLREMARKMGISHCYLKLLEKGERVWTADLEGEYRDYLEN